DGGGRLPRRRVRPGAQKRDETPFGGESRRPVRNKCASAGLAVVPMAGVARVIEEELLTLYRIARHRARRRRAGTGAGGRGTSTTLLSPAACPLCEHSVTDEHDERTGVDEIRPGHHLPLPRLRDDVDHVGLAALHGSDA